MFPSDSSACPADQRSIRAGQISRRLFLIPGRPVADKNAGDKEPWSVYLAGEGLVMVTLADVMASERRNGC